MIASRYSVRQSASVAGRTRAIDRCASPRRRAPRSRASSSVVDERRAGACARPRAVDQQRLGRAADAGAPQLRVQHDRARHLEVGVAVDVDVADALEVADHRHPRLGLHARDEALAAARHDHVDEVGHAGEHLADRGAVGGRHQLDRGLRQARAPQAGGEAGVDRDARVEALASRRAGSRRCRT